MEDTRATRRRGATLESAILDAVWDEIAAVGYAGLTIEGVAARAQTSKAVLYRRWSGKAELVFAALVRRFPTAEDVPDTGELRSDLISFLRRIARRFAEVDMDVVWGLLAETARDSRLAELVQSQVVDAARQSPMATIIDRAVRRGELDPAKLTPRRVMLPLDLLRNELLVSGGVTDTAIAEIVDEIALPLLRSD